MPPQEDLGGDSATQILRSCSSRHRPHREPPPFLHSGDSTRKFFLHCVISVGSTRYLLSGYRLPTQLGPVHRRKVPSSSCVLTIGSAGAGESRVESGAGVRLSWVLERDADAAARGVFDDLFGLAVEVVVPQTATGEVARG
jgi:hypothetical protein